MYGDHYIVIIRDREDIPVSRRRFSTRKGSGACLFICCMNQPNYTIQPTHNIYIGTRTGTLIISLDQPRQAKATYKLGIALCSRRGQRRRQRQETKSTFEY